MSSFNLAQMARRTRNIRRRVIILNTPAPPGTFAGNLFRSAYLPVIQAWERAIPSISAEYERTLSEMTTDSPADIQGEIEAAEGSIQRLFLTLTPELRDWALSVERWTRDRWSRAVMSATGVDLTTMIGPADARQTMEAAVNWNVSLIKDISAQAAQRISNAVFSGLREGKAARDVAKELREVAGMARRRAMNIASHQLSSLHAALAQERRREAGLVIFQWLHSSKKHPREHHLARNGNYYTEDETLVGRRINGKVIRKAPEASDRASVPPFCGCRELSVLAFVFDDDE